MTHFGNILNSEESLFKNETALDYSFIPKLIPYRETQQKIIAATIKPLFEQRNGRNILIYGKPGVGKTVACKHVINEIEEHTDDIYVIYINCWKRKTTYQVALEMCDVLGYKFIQNKKTEDLLEIVKQMLNKKSAVFVLDEVDKLEDTDLLYYLLEEVYKKTIILLTNFKDWITNLDERIKSRLTAEIIEFKPYTATETNGILKQRMEFAFVTGVWEEEAFNTIAQKTYQQQDIRQGLYLMKESGNAAEDRASRKIEQQDVQKAIQKLDEFNIKDPEDLEDDTNFVLAIIKQNEHGKIGEIFKQYQDQGGKRAYKSFQRKIKTLEQGKFITTEKQTGAGGNTTILKTTKQEKKLTEF